MSMNDTPGVRLVRMTLWIYFWLLFLEGVLRKWVLPQYSDVLFVVRDPVAIVAYLSALRAGVFPWRPAVIVLWAMMVLALAFAATVESPLLVTFFGLRTNFLHLPLVFLMGTVFDRDDVLHFGRWLMWLAAPIVALMILQFDSDPDHVLNVGAGGVERAQLHGALGRIRPPGPFSFIASVAMYFGLTAAFLFHGWLQRENHGRATVVLASLATVAALPVSVSRSVLFALLLTAVFALAAVVREPRRLVYMLGPLVIAVATLSVLSGTAYMDTFVARWDEARMAEGGSFRTNVVGRVLATYLSPFYAALEAPLLGHGVGLGTVAGAKLSTGKVSFLLAEDELARCVFELGPLLGFGYIAWRFWLAAHLLRLSWRRIRETGDLLPWLIGGSMSLPILVTQFGPATQLGFVVFGSGLALAALNEPAPTEATEASEEESDT